MLFKDIEEYNRTHILKNSTSLYLKKMMFFTINFGHTVELSFTFKRFIGGFFVQDFSFEKILVNNNN